MPRLIPTSVRRVRAGFTLPEVLVTLLILGIVGGAIFKVLVKQQQSYSDTRKQADMQREIRLTSSYLPGDLRSLSSSGGDLFQMDEDKIEFLANIGSGIICEKASTTHFVVPPLNAADVTITNWYATPRPGDSVFVYDDSASTGSEDDVWQRRVVQTVDKSTGYCPGLPFTDPVQDAGKERYRFGVGGAGGDAIPSTSRLGSVVRFARPVRYRLYQEASGKWYIGFQQFVTGAWTTIEPVGGPFRPYAATDAGESGLQFRYFDSLGVRLTSVADAKRLSRVDVYLRTNAGLASVTERRPNDVRDSVMMRIAVRNFK